MSVRTKLATVLVLLGALGVVTPPPAAWAHASLVASTPADGDRLAALPAQAVLTFSEEISAPAYVVVTAPDGSRADAGDPSVDGQEVRTGLARTGQEGTYALAFRAVSADGHPVTGRLTFVVGDGPLDPAGPAPASGDPAAAPGTTTGTGTTEGATTSAAGGSGVELWHVQVAVALGLFLAAALLYAQSRRGPA